MPDDDGQQSCEQSGQSQQPPKASVSSSSSRTCSSESIRLRQRSNSKEQHYGRQKSTSSSSSFPLLVGVFPAIAALLFGDAKQWVESLFVLFLAIWVYYVLQAPWNAYQQCRRLSYTKSERFFIVLIFSSPLIAGYCIHAVRALLRDQIRLLDNFSIPLFLLASILRPMIYFMRECGNGDGNAAADECQVEEEVRRDASNGQVLLGRMERLERSFREIPSTVDSSVPCRGCARLRERTNQIDERLRCLERVVGLSGPLASAKPTILGSIFSVFLLPVSIARRMVRALLDI